MSTFFFVCDGCNLYLIHLALPIFKKYFLFLELQGGLLLIFNNLAKHLFNIESGGFNLLRDKAGDGHAGCSIHL